VTHEFNLQVPAAYKHLVYVKFIRKKKYLKDGTFYAFQILQDNLKKPNSLRHGRARRIRKKIREYRRERACV